MWNESENMSLVIIISVIMFISIFCSSLVIDQILDMMTNGLKCKI